MPKLMASCNHWLLLLPPHQILLDILTSRQSSQCIASLPWYNGNTKPIFRWVGVERRLKLRCCWPRLDFNLDASPSHGCIGDVDIVLLIPENFLHLFVIFQN